MSSRRSGNRNGAQANPNSSGSSKFSKSAGGGAASGESNSFPSPSTHPRPGNLQRLANLQLFEMTSEDCFAFIAHSVPFIKQYERSWRIPGSKFADFHPSVVAPNLQLELPLLPRSAALEIVRCVKAKIAHDWNREYEEGVDFVRLRPEAIPAWSSYEVPALEIPNPEPQASAQNHGGGAGHSQGIPPPPIRNGPPFPAIQHSLLWRLSGDAHRC